VLPDNRIETARDGLQGDRQPRRLFLGHRAIVVIHVPALCIEHLNHTEAWRNPLTEPEGYLSHRLLQHGVGFGDSPQEVRMRIHVLCAQYKKYAESCKY